MSFKELGDQTAAVMGKILDCYTHNRRLYDKVFALFPGRVPPNKTIADLIDRPDLLTQLIACQRGVTVTLTIDEALQSFNADKGHVIVNLLDVDIFLVYNPIEHRDVCSQLRKLTTTGAEGSEAVAARQIVFSNDNQRLVFLCNMNNDKENAELMALQKALQDHFRTTSTMASSDDITEIMIDKIVGSHDEVKTAFKEVCVKLRNRGIISPSKLNVLMEFDTVCGKKYTSPLMYEDRIGTKQVLPDKEADALHSTFAGVNFSAGKIEINITNNYAAAPVQMSAGDIAKKWVSDNPPKNRESKQAYYAKYTDANPANLLAKRLFTPIVKAAGYKDIHPTQEGWVWVKA